MKALITGASSGIGYEMAKILSEKGYDIIAVARREEKLKKLKEEIKTDVEILCLDVTRDEDIEKIAEWISGAPKYFLQNFVDSGNLIGENFTAHKRETLRQMQEIASKTISSVEVRGI